MQLSQAMGRSPTRASPNTGAVLCAGLQMRPLKASCDTQLSHHVPEGVRLRGWTFSPARTWMEQGVPPLSRRSRLSPRSCPACSWLWASRRCMGAVHRPGPWWVTSIGPLFPCRSLHWDPSHHQGNCTVRGGLRNSGRACPALGHCPVRLHPVYPDPLACLVCPSTALTMVTRSRSDWPQPRSHATHSCCSCPLHLPSHPRTLPPLGVVYSSAGMKVTADHFLWGGGSVHLSHC